ncbi:MAG: hypothetical protein R2909_14820 [Gemmatimonadales bacterium]
MTVDSSGLVTTIDAGAAYLIGELVRPAGTLADSTLVTVVCTLEIRQEFEPPSQTLSVGESFTPRVTITTCGGHRP